MAKKNDLKNSMSAGLTGGLDSLIQSTAGQKEAQKPKKAKTVHCNFVMDETYNSVSGIYRANTPQKKFSRKKVRKKQPYT